MPHETIRKFHVDSPTCAKVFQVFHFLAKFAHLDLDADLVRYVLPHFLKILRKISPSLNWNCLHILATIYTRFPEQFFEILLKISINLPKNLPKIFPKILPIFFWHSGGFSDFIGNSSSRFCFVLVLEKKWRRAAGRLRRLSVAQLESFETRIRRAVKRYFRFGYSKIKLTDDHQEQCNWSGLSGGPISQFEISLFVNEKLQSLLRIPQIRL